MTRVIRAAWIPYETRRLGWMGLLLPALIGVPFAGLAALMQAQGGEAWSVSRMLAAYLEAGLPLAAALATANIVTDDPALDLHLSLKTGYLTTVLRRLGALVGLSAALAALWTSTMFLLGLWGPWVPEPYWRGQLVWLSPLLFFVTLGCVLAVLLRSRSAAGAVLGGYWLGSMLFKDYLFAIGWLKPFYPFATLRAPGAGFWLGNRLALILTAAALFLAFAALLRRESVVLGGES